MPPASVSLKLTDFTTCSLIQPAPAVCLFTYVLIYLLVIIIIVIIYMFCIVFCLLIFQLFVCFAGHGDDHRSDPGDLKESSASHRLSTAKFVDKALKKVSAFFGSSSIVKTTNDVDKCSRK